MVAPDADSDLAERGRLPPAPPFLTLAGLVIGSGWLAGVLSASLGFQIPIEPVLVLTIFATIAALVSRRSQLLLIPMAVAVLFLGAARYTDYLDWRVAQSSTLIEHVGSEVIAAGTVSEATFDRDDQARLRIEVDEIEGPDGPDFGGWIIDSLGLSRRRRWNRRPCRNSRSPRYPGGERRL